MAQVIMDGRPENFQHLIDNGYEFKMGDYLRKGWKIFAEYPFGFIGFFLIAAMASAMGGIIPFLGIFIQVALQGPLYAGGYIVARKISRGEKYEFADFFTGFDYFKDLFIGNLLVTLFTIFGLLLLIVPGIYLAVAYSLVIPFIIFGKLEAWDAMETCRKMITKNWLSFFGMLFVFMGYAILGLLCFFVGIFAVAPLIHCTWYAVYEDIVAKQDDPLFNIIDEIGSDAIDNAPSVEQIPPTGW